MLRKKASKLTKQEANTANSAAAPEAAKAENSTDSISMRDKVICLSGTFTYGKKAYILAKIAEFGGKGVDNLTNATEILLVGTKDSQAYAFDTYGSKYEKATKMNIPVYHNRNAISKMASFVPGRNHNNGGVLSASEKPQGGGVLTE